MQTICIRTSQNVTIEYRLAGLGDRLLAYLFDALVIISYFILLSGFNYLLTEMFGIGILEHLWLQVILIMPWFLYDLLCEVFMEGQSFGKKIMKIRVVRTDGESVTLGNYLIRWLTGLIELKLMGGIMALLAIVMGGKGQRLGDMAAGTTVVYLGDEKTMSMSLPSIPTDIPPIYPQATNLSDADVGLIKEVLYTYSRTGNRKLLEATADKLLEKLELERFKENTALDFLKQVITDHSRLVK
ncbi:RDD family protein [Rhodoflexus sp.]